MNYGFKKLLIVLFISMLYAFSMVFFYYQKEKLSEYQNKQIELTDEIKQKQKTVSDEDKIRARALKMQFKYSTRDDIIIIDDEP